MGSLSSLDANGIDTRSLSFHDDRAVQIRSVHRRALVCIKLERRPIWVPVAVTLANVDDDRFGRELGNPCSGVALVRAVVAGFVDLHLREEIGMVRQPPCPLAGLGIASQRHSEIPKLHNDPDRIVVVIPIWDARRRDDCQCRVPELNSSFRRLDELTAGAAHGFQ